MADAVRTFLDDFIAKSDFSARYPYYAAALGKMLPVADPSVKRMAVSLYEGRFYLHINVESFLREPQYLRGVLLHEVHHVVLGHLSHPKFADVAEPELCDLALEMSANEYIEEPLPDPIVWQKYARFGLRAGQSTLERYEKLLEASRSGKLGANVGDGEVLDDHRRFKKTTGEPGAIEQTRQLVAQSMEEVGDSNDSQDPRRSLLAGKDPGKLIEEIDAWIGPPTYYVDWKTALAMFASQQRTPVGTFSRPSRRFPGRIGEVPGRAWSPRAMNKPRLIVAIDTSMSMTVAEFEEIAKHLSRIHEQAFMTIVECDADIQRVYPFTGKLTDVVGRGGTDLCKVFSDSFLRLHLPDGIVYFTDGDGPFPDEPPRIPTLWILTKPAAFACPWGHRAVLERKVVR
jgi:predicted metal-dependent peptidase